MDDERRELKETGEEANGDGAGFNRISQERVKWVEFERDMKRKKGEYEGGEREGFPGMQLTTPLALAESHPSSRSRSPSAGRSRRSR